MVEVILNLKAEVKQNFDAVLQEFNKALQESTDFADRLKNLRTKAIRADVVFQFIEDLRTGELKKWFTDTLSVFHSELSQALEDLANTARSLKVLKNPAQGVLGLLVKIAGFWIMVNKFVTVLHGLLPVVQALADKLAEFEQVIMKQSNPRIRLKKTISARDGALRA